MESARKVAYFRDLPLTNQCELAFELRVEVRDVGLMHEDVRAVRQSTDTVGSLLHHIVKKINKLAQTMQDAAEDAEIDSKPALKSRNQHLKPARVLKSLFNATLEDLEFSVFGQSYRVWINAPVVKTINLPSTVYANFSIQPRKFFTMYTDNKASKFLWYKSRDKVNWTKVGDTYRYMVSEDDIGSFLKMVCVPCANGLAGPPTEIVSENAVEKIGEIPRCPFEERHKHTTEKLDGDRLRVVSYNVLSDRYTEDGQFSYCPAKVLALDYRKQLVIKEILGYRADIICLQEVDCGCYATYYKQLLKEAGYSSYYHRKGDRISEGLACAFDKARFKKIDDHQIVYSNVIEKNRQFKYLWNLVKSNREVKDTFLRQATSLHVTVLKERVEARRNNFVIVANTHLFYHPEAEHIRLLQINMATTHLSILRKQYSKEGENRPSVILCGDFNCVPSSDVVKYITEGRINQGEIARKISDKVDLFHPFKFQSACGFPKYTNYTKDFKDCLDYIFVEKNKMKVLSVVPFPKEEELAVYEGLPSDIFPSDHLALVADLQFA